MWSRMDFAEQAGIVSTVDENDPKSLLAEITRLRADKRDLAAELEKMQRMVKLNEDLIREKAQFFKEESQLLTNQNEILQKKIQSSNIMVETK
jgi:hypothetical protein